MRIWPGSFGVTTPDDLSIVVHRDFDAPPGKVWQAMTEPKHLRRWLGDPSFPLTICEMDVRVGGTYRWVFTRPDGAGTMGVHGSYDEVERPHRIVSTEQFDDFPGPSQNTLELDERADGRTAMRLTVRYVDREMRDGWFASGMTEGLGRGYERLDEVLKGIARP
jgi:uncharacterized protein YndB with AHSA1/START domain